MLNELSPYAEAPKLNDLIARLESRRTNTALAAEAELSVLWGISRVASITLEPRLPNSANRPDALSADLFASAPAIIEVRALSDDSFSGNEVMNRTANIIVSYADKVRKAAGQHLYFEFLERSYWKDGFHRERCVDPEFQLSTQAKELLRQWITASDCPSPIQIRITEGKTDVVISWHQKVHRNSRVSCRMPPVAYDIEDNPIYKALRDKSRKIKGGGNGTIRCVFLADAGCYLLGRLRPMGGGLEIPGERIVWHALKKHSIDLVFILSPERRGRPWMYSDSFLYWKITYFDRREGFPMEEYKKLDEMAMCLPLPRFEGYQARDHHRQGRFNINDRGWYLATKACTNGDMGMTIKISSRLVQELLSGRISKEEFNRYAFAGNKNLFDLELSRGNTIRSVEFEESNLDEDDDYIIFHLDFDWSMNSLESRQKSAKNET